MLPIDSPDGTIIHGEFVPDTWGDGLNKLPYPPPVREAFKKFKKEMMAIDLERRGQELANVPFTDFTNSYPVEIRQWWDAYGPSNWGATSEESAAAVAIGELQEMAAESRADTRYTWPGGIGAMTGKLCRPSSAKVRRPDADRSHHRGGRPGKR